MVNPFNIKEKLAFVLAGFIPVVVGVLIYIQTEDFLLFGVGCILSICIGCFLYPFIIKNPFSEMLKGKGYLVFVIDSVGIIDPFLVYKDGNFLKNKEYKIESVFNRNMTTYIKAPQKIKQNKEINNILTIPTDNPKQYEFGMLGFPCFIYSSILKSFISKDELSKKEYHLLTNHLLLNIQSKIDKMRENDTTILRYYSDKFFSSNGILGFLSNPSTIIWGFIIVLIVIILIFGPQFITKLQQPVTDTAIATSLIK